MINVNDIKIFLDFVVNKEQSGTAYSIVQLNVAFQAANIDFFNKRYGLPEEYIPGTPIPSQSYEVTQKIKDDLRAVKEKIIIPVDSFGIMLLPSNYVHKTAIEYVKIINDIDCDVPDVSYKSVEIIDDDKWSERISNSIKKPSLDFPVCNFLKDSIRFMPKNLKEVELSYLREPNKPIWGYSFQGGIETYDASSSTDFEWNYTLFTEMVRIVASYLGWNLRDGEFNELMAEYKEKGA